MKIAELLKSSYAKTGIAVLVALLAYRFIDVVWFALFVGGGFAIVHHYVAKAGGPKKAWEAIVKFLEIDLT